MFQNGTCALSFQFSTLVDVGEVLCYHRSFSAEQVSNLFLCHKWQTLLKLTFDTFGLIRGGSVLVCLPVCGFVSGNRARLAREADSGVLRPARRIHIRRRGRVLP